MLHKLPQLPLDLSTFRDLREGSYLYVDKTEYAYNLITGGRRYFLSRPRRFGKTLFVSTLKEILLGNKDLFEGLWIAQSDYPWHRYGVVTLDLSSWGIKNADSLATSLKRALLEVAQEYGLIIDTSPLEPEVILRSVVKALKVKYGRVALLIDEYDSPILHAQQDSETAKKIRDGLKTFFTALKGLDAELSFLFITGVSNFAKAGLFSGLNNLRVISLDTRYAAICGYTEEEITHYLQPYLQAWATKSNKPLAVLREEMKQWYNGYQFCEEPIKVYNPFSLLHAIDAKKIKNFWFQTGTPTFLVEELQKKYRQQEYRMLDVENTDVSEETLGIFDVGATPLPALMFQTGYLTIVDYDQQKKRYKLGYPNAEVKTTLQKHLLAALVGVSFDVADSIADQFLTALDTGDVQEATALFAGLCAKVPYQLHAKEESFYHALFQIVCDAVGIKTISEYSTNRGRVDVTLELPHLLYVIEIKLNESAEAALEQIEK